jgi:hypothetical protein
MSEYCGNLLIGGMALKDLQCYIEPEGSVKCKVWSGRLSVNPSQREMLEIGRTYRLELNDGRAGQLVLTDMHVEPGAKHKEELVLLFEGTSALE